MPQEFACVNGHPRAGGDSSLDHLSLKAGHRPFDTQVTQVESAVHARLKKATSPTRFRNFKGFLTLAWSGEIIRFGSMGPGRAILVYLLAVFVGGALVAPWLHLAAHWSAEHLPVLQSVANSPFHRYVHRCLLGLALLGLWPFLRVMGIRTWKDVGLPRPSGEWRMLGLGLGIGFASLACLFLMAQAFGARQWEFDKPLGAIGWDLGGTLLVAVVVGMLEEVLFRGGLMGTLQRAHAWTLALLVSSLIYASVHFFEHPASPAVINGLSGFVVLYGMMGGLFDLTHLVPGFFNLTLAGVILGLTYHWTGTIYCSIGLHAGWIFWMKSFGLLTAAVPGSNLWLWGTNRVVDGWLTLAILALTLLVVIRTLNRSERNRESQ